jgi:anti-anti-sigma regulatory factor
MRLGGAEHEHIETGSELRTEEAQDSSLSPVSRHAVERAPLGSDAWQIITLLPRLDSSNHSDLMTEIHSVLAEGSRRIALDLTHNQFFSLNAIQLCVSLARDLSEDDGGFAIIGCGERTKKHFEIYGSLKQITMVRTASELVQDRTHAVIMRP